MKFLFTLVCFVFFPTFVLGSPRVVVTLKPIHGLVSSVMENVGTPTLLLPDGASPHTFQMKPSTLKHIKEAELIIWVGPTLETFMTKALTNSSATILTLTQLPTIQKLPQRQGKAWETAHSHEHDEDQAPHDHTDPHIWLNVENASAIMDAIAQKLAAQDPEHASLYLANAQKTKIKLNTLHDSLQQQLIPVQTIPFLVYHDGYQYFEEAFDLNAKGTVISNPHLPLSAYGLKKIKEKIAAEHIQCVFRETEFSNQLIEKSLKNLDVHVVELDPLGVRFPAGADHYFKTMEALGNNMVECLHRPSP